MKFKCCSELYQIMKSIIKVQVRCLVGLHGIVGPYVIYQTNRKFKESRVKYNNLIILSIFLVSESKSEIRHHDNASNHTWQRLY